VMPLAVPEEHALGGWLPSLQSELLDALEHGHCPYPRLHQELARPGQPLYGAVFMYQNWVRSTQRRLAASGRHLQPMLQIQQQVDFPLAFEVFEGEEGSTLFCHFDAAIYPLALMQDLQKQYLELLAELPQLCASQQAPQTAEPTGQASLATLFERQVALTPHQVALICDDQPLDYQQLNERANQLARRIRQSLPAHDDKGWWSVCCSNPGRNLSPLCLRSGNWAWPIWRWTRHCRATDWRTWWPTVVASWWSPTARHTNLCKGLWNGPFWTWMPEGHRSTRKMSVMSQVRDFRTSAM